MSAPDLIQLPLVNSRWPTAATTMSASLRTADRLAVLEWQYVTVALRSSSIPTGLPKMELWPMTTAC